MTLSKTINQNKPAAAGKRLLAYVIDQQIYLASYLALIGWVLSSQTVDRLFTRLVWMMVAVFVLYPALSIILALMTAKLGGSPGKLLIGIKVVDSDDKYLSFKRAFFRSFVGYMVSGSLAGLGFFWIFKNNGRRAWHDMMVGSFVMVAHKARWTIGLVGLIILVGGNIWLGTRAVEYYQTNKSFFIEFFAKTKDTLFSSNKETNPNLNEEKKTTVAGYLSYTDADNTVTFQYPPDWTIQEGMSGTKVMFLSPRSGENDLFPENVNLIIQDISQNPITQSQFTMLIIQQIEKTITDSQIQAELSATTLAGQPANKVVYSGKQGQYDLQWNQNWTTKDNKIYIVTYAAQTENYDQYLEQAENIIVSFKFLP